MWNEALGKLRPEVWQQGHQFRAAALVTAKGKVGWRGEAVGSHCRSWGSLTGPDLTTSPGVLDLPAPLPVAPAARQGRWAGLATAGGGGGTCGRPNGGNGRGLCAPAGPVVKVIWLELPHTGQPEPQDAEHPPEPKQRHLDRHFRSTLGSWRCPLLGLLLGMCAAGGCESRFLASGVGIL